MQETPIIIDLFDTNLNVKSCFIKEAAYLFWLINFDLTFDLENALKFNKGI